MDNYYLARVEMAITVKFVVTYTSLYQNFSCMSFGVICEYSVLKYEHHQKEHNQISICWWYKTNCLTRLQEPQRNPFKSAKRH